MDSGRETYVTGKGNLHLKMISRTLDDGNLINLLERVTYIFPLPTTNIQVDIYNPWMPFLNHFNTGDWVNGKKEGRGLESAEYGTYSGGWKSDMRHGHGEERTIVGTVFNGQWERGRKHGQGERKIAYGLVEEQVCVHLSVYLLQRFV